MDLYEDSSELAELAERVADYSNLDPLVSKILKEFDEDKTARESQDAIFTKCHLNYKGVYPSSFSFSGTSKAFVKLTGPRVLHAIARLMEVVAPVGEDAFTYDPTPYPRMPQLEMQLRGQGLPEEDVVKAVKIASDQASVNLTIKTKDALSEDNWNTKLQDFITNMCLYGTGVMSGPMAEPSNSSPSTAFRALNSVSDDIRPSVESVLPLRFYPQAGAFSVEGMRHATVYETVDRSVLLDWSKNSDMFDTEALEDVLSRNVDGDWAPLQWEQDLMNANENKESGPCGKFQVLNYWGFLTGQELKDSGVQVPEDMLDSQILANVFVCGGKAIRITTSELHRDRLPFYVVGYSHVPMSIWGCGVAEKMSDSQAAYNACERAKYDNLAFSATGHVTIVNVDRLYDPRDAASIGPKCVLRTKDSENNKNDRPVEFQLIPCIMRDIEATQANLMMLIQDQTGIPNVLLGSGGEGVHNRTSSGASLQYNSAITPLKGVVMNVENHLIIPMMTKVKEFFYMFSMDESIKGDSKVSAKGVSGLIARETASMRLDALLARAAQNEQWAAQIDMSRVGQILFKQTGLAGERLTYTKAEAEENQRRRQEQEVEMEQMKAAGMAQIETDASKQRAETSPTDIVLQVMTEAPEGSTVQYTAMRQVLQMKGLLTPEMDAALTQAVAMASHEQGVAMAERENPMVANAKTKQR